MPLPSPWAAARRRWLQHRLRRPEYAFVLEPGPPGEWVAIDCETTGLDVRTDEVVSIGAVRVCGQSSSSRSVPK